MGHLQPSSDAPPDLRLVASSHSKLHARTLKEKWLYAQPRDEEVKEERIQFTLQLHADMHLAKDATSAPGVDWTEDCDGLGELDDAAETESRLVASADVQDAQPQDSSGQAA